jgi:hypothetical protein
MITCIALLAVDGLEQSKAKPGKIHPSKKIFTFESVLPATQKRFRNGL